MQEDHPRECAQSAGSTPVAVIRELLWVSSLAHLTNKTGVHFLPLVASGVADVAVHLQVWPATERAFREAAIREGRKGWSSGVLASHLARQIVSTWTTVPIFHRGTRAHLTLDPQACSEIASVLEHDQMAIQQASEYEHEQGHAAALSAAKEMELSYFVKLGEAGIDIRWGVIREAMSMIGRVSGLGEPQAMGSPAFERRGSPDGKAVAASQALTDAVESLPLLVGDALIAMNLTIVGIARMQPRGKCWTGVLLSARFPGTETLYAAWNADSKRVDG